MSSNQNTRRWVLTALVVFLLLLTPLNSIISAASVTPSLKLLETDWRTGELEISYENAIQGYTMVVFAATHESSGEFIELDRFTASGSEGKHITSYLENGQSIWYYVMMISPEGEQVRSNRLKQTPPITAFIINWPDMLKDLDQMINNALKNAMTPSDNAMDNLKDAIDNLANSVGAGSANGAGNDLQDAINNGQSGMKKPIVNDDGNGTYTGGSTGGKLPQDTTTGEGGLKYPDPSSGTHTELTVCLPYGVDMQGNLLKACLFTEEQMEKMKWLDILRKLCGATIWVMFAIWLVQRFTPQLKV